MAGKKKTDSKPKDKDAAAKGGQGQSQGKSKELSERMGAGNVKGAQSIVVRHILCKKFSKKEEIMEKLRGGENFESMAQDFSEDKANAKGLLGTIRKGQLFAEFEKVAFTLPAAKDVKGIYPYGEAKTSEGYHIIRVDARK